MRNDRDNPSPIRRVLLTGALGKIGSKIAGDLAAYYEIIPTDLPPSDMAGYVHADLTNFEETFRLMQGIDAVVHLATATGDGRSKTLPPDKLDPVDERMLRVNPTCIHHVLEAAARQGVRRVVYISSLTVVLKDKERPSYAVEMPPDPTNLYACTKLFGEQLAYVKWREKRLSTICLRLGQPTPIGHAFDEIWRTNRRSRSFRVHFLDIIGGIRGAIEAAASFGVYNLVSASDNPRVDLSGTRRDLGYEPRAYFGEDCLVVDGKRSP